MKLVSVIAAGVIAGLALPSAAAHAQGGGGGFAKRAAELQRPQNNGRPNNPRDDDARDNRGRGADRERDRDQGESRAPMRLVPLNAVVAQISRSTPGRLLDASGPSGGDRPIYRIRWQAASGQRIDFVVDAQSGAIIGQNGG